MTWNHGDTKKVQKDTEASMPRSSLLKCLSIFLLSLSILACSHLTSQQTRETPQPSPTLDCRNNLSTEMSLFSGTTYKTWVQYDNLDYNRAFDAAVFAMRNKGHSITSTDRELGTIHGERSPAGSQQTRYPIDVKIAKEKTSLIVNLGFKATDGERDLVILCSFYEEFEKMAKHIPTVPPPRETSKPTIKPVQPPPAKDQTPDKPVIPPVEAKEKPTPPPPSSRPPSPPPRVTEVVWTSVNLREGPGMNYKVIGNAKKGTSLRILEDNGSWLRVRLEDGREVWVSKSATPDAPKAAPPPFPPRTSSAPSSKPAPSRPASPM
jgi:Bacterial SH3 domain